MFFFYEKGVMIPQIEMIDKTDVFTESEKRLLTKASYQIAAVLKDIFLERAPDQEKKQEAMLKVQTIMKSL